MRNVQHRLNYKQRSPWVSNLWHTTGTSTYNHSQRVCSYPALQTTFLVWRNSTKRCLQLCPMSNFILLALDVSTSWAMFWIIYRVFLCHLVDVFWNCTLNKYCLGHSRIDSGYFGKGVYHPLSTQRIRVRGLLGATDYYSNDYCGEIGHKCCHLLAILLEKFWSPGLCAFMGEQ